jgi:hypothetical protein
MNIPLIIHRLNALMPYALATTLTLFITLEVMIHTMTKRKKK